MIEDIRAHALEEYPREACGVVKEGRYVPTKNVADDPENTFQIHPNAMRGAEAVIHSHPDWYPVPSQTDMEHQIRTAMPWGVIATDGAVCGDLVWFGDQVEREPLVGRRFVHGVTDCYGLIRDWYLLERGVTLPDFPRNWEWWLKGQSLYLDHFADAGFRRLEQQETPQTGDVAFATLRSKIPNHAGVLLDGGLLLHHLTGAKPIDKERVSRRDPITRYNRFINFWVRYDG